MVDQRLTLDELNEVTNLQVTDLILTKRPGGATSKTEVVISLTWGALRRAFMPPQQRQLLLMLTSLAWLIAQPPFL